MPFPRYFITAVYFLSRLQEDGAVLDLAHVYWPVEVLRLPLEHSAGLALWMDLEDLWFIHVVLLWFVVYVNAQVFLAGTAACQGLSTLRPRFRVISSLCSSWWLLIELIHHARRRVDLRSISLHLLIVCIRLLEILDQVPVFTIEHGVLALSLSRQGALALFQIQLLLRPLAEPVGIHVNILVDTEASLYSIVLRGSRNVHILVLILSGSVLTACKGIDVFRLHNISWN